MYEEAISLPTKENAMNAYTYQTVESLQSLAKMVHFIATTRTTQLALVTITLYFSSEEANFPARQQLAERSTHYLLENLRTLVRKTDIVFLYKHQFHFLLLDANIQGGRIVQERLWEALIWRAHSLIDGDLIRPQAMAIGYSAYPKPCNTSQDLIKAACNPRLEFNTTNNTLRSRAEVMVAESSISEQDDDLPQQARKLGVPYLPQLPRKLPKHVQHLLSPQLAQELHCYPLGREKNTLTVAMSDPQDRHALCRLQQETGLHIYPVLAHPEELEFVLNEVKPETVHQTVE